MLFDIVYTVLWSVVLLPALYLAGTPAGFFLGNADRMMRGIIYVVFGLGIFAYYIVLLGHLQLLSVPGVSLFFVFVYTVLWRRFNEFSRWLSEIWIFFTHDKRSYYRWWVAVFLLMGGATFLFSIIPETANDSLCYQLNIPKIFAKHHSTQPLFYDMNSYMPMMMQHLYTASLVLGSSALAKLFHWITGILLFFSVFVTIFQITQRKLLALYCAFAMWLTPTCINEVSSTYVDIALALFLFLSIWIFGEGLKQKTARVFLLGGIFLGFVVSIKLIALLWVAVFVILFFGATFKCFQRSEFIKIIFYTTLSGFIGCGFWFIRNWVMEHNPVFPYMESLFGGPSLGLMGAYAEVGLPKTLASFLLLPWNITFRPDVFDRGFWIGPFYFLAIPFALWGAWKSRMARFCLAFVFLSTVAWFFVVQNVRFLFPVLPVYLLAVAMGYAHLKGLGPVWLRFLKIAAGTLVVFLLALAVYHYRYPLRVVAGRWSPEQYLEKMERSYPAAQWVNQNLPENAFIFNAEEVRQFYFKRDMVREVWFRSRTHYDQTVGAADLLAHLKEKGFTHILRVYPSGRAGDKNEGSHFEILDRALSDPARARSLTTIESKNIREDRYRYSIFEIMGER